MRKFKRNELSKELLKISGGLLIIGAVIVAPGLAEIYRYYKAYKRSEKARIRQAMRKLEGKKYIRVREINNGTVLSITPEGKKELLRYDYDDLKIKKPNIWDKKWRIIIFDIPEKKKIVRDQINLKLKELGFEDLQKSTFIFPYECRNEVEFIKNHFYLKNEIRYILAEEIDNQSNLVKLFGLKI